MANLQRGLTPALIDKLADKIVDEYPYYNLTMQDLNIVLERGVLGQYSKDGMLLVINAAVVIAWIDRYFEERVGVAEGYNTRENDKAPIYERRSTVTLRTMIRNIRERENLWK